MPDFEREYQRLNASQQQAVNYIDGPLLVIAGPGTGKTQLLSLRVANILQKTDASPDNVLCLTFTNKAANNMRERLSALIGPAGSRVPIRTFHSFASELMSSYPDYFWNGAQLTNVPDAVQLEIITSILETLPLSNPLALKFAGIFTVTKDVKASLKLAKEAGLTPDKLRSLIELNVRYIDIVEPELVSICSDRLSAKKIDSLASRIEKLPTQDIDEFTRPLISLSTTIVESFQTAYDKDAGTGKTTNLSKWKARWISTVNGEKGMFAERKRNAWWLALSDVYATYRDQLHQRGYYDYADMIVEVITQLEQQPEMLASVQERYQYVLIDEFQDTNAAQLRLAHLIADHYASAGKPNIMAVGDDDQSIYKFNGAELSNMLGFRRSYPAAKLVVLTDNYRSTQAILDFSERVIAQASERVTTMESSIQKVLTAQNAPASNGTIEHISFPTVMHQYEGIAQKVADVFQQTSSVAVLARSHDSLKKLAAILQKNQVPIRYEQQQSIFEQEIIQQITTVARAAHAIASGDQGSVNQYVAELLSHPVWGITDHELWQLAIQNRTYPAWLDSMLRSDEEHQQNLANWLLWLGRESLTQPLPRIFEYIIGLSASEHLTSPIREYFLRPQAIDGGYVAGLSATQKLLDLCRDFSRQGQATLEDFVRLVTVSENNNQTVVDDSVFVTAPNAVELLTVHKAKGLEFDCVFVLDAMDSVWRPTLSGRKPPANLPLKPQGDDLDDYIRLMFVAITRARHSLYISSYYTGESGSSVLPSAIIRDVLPATQIKLEDASAPLQTLEHSLSWPRLAGGNEKLLLREVMQNFSLSATAFLNFLDVAKGGPAYFLERHILRLPEATSPRAAFGSALHGTLEFAQQQVRNASFNLGQVLARYETLLEDQYLSQNDHQRYLAHGQQVLTRLFNEYHLELNPTGQAEIILRGISLGNARVNGALDRVDTTGQATLISDYKTSTPLTNLLTRSKTTQIKAWHHRTQLEFYILLAQASGQYDNHALSAQMIYVEAESEKELYLAHTPTPEDLARLQQLIQVVWEKIISLNLPDTRHYDPSYDGIRMFEQDLLDGKI